MAVDLVPASSQYISASSSVVNLLRGTFCAWIAPDFATDDGNPHYFFDTTDARHAFYYYNTGAANVIEMYNDGRVTRFATFSWTVGVYSSFIFIYNRTGNVQRLILDGTELTGGGKSGTWGTTALGADFFAGARFNATEFSDGDWAELATYSVADLTTGEVAALSKGVSPRLVRPQSLTAYWPLIRDGRPQKGSVAATLNGSPSVTAQPRIFYPTGYQLAPFSAAVASTTRRYSLPTLGVS